jgi:phosphopentomutase
VVLDACGVGALPDAADYGDAGTNTLGHLAHEAGGLELPTLARLAETTDLVRALRSGFVFTNLVENDQVYGHRHDVAGFHHALREIDAAVAEWTALLGPEDLLVLTADHGCDPTSPRTDHTREYAPLLAAFAGHRSRRHRGSLADVGASALAWLGGERTLASVGLRGESFV